MSVTATSAAKLQKLVLPAQSKHTATLLFLHGLGDSGEGGWKDVFLQLQRSQFPQLKVILPTAPHRPVKANGGMRMNAWWDIEKFNNQEHEKFGGIDESRAGVEAIIAEEIASHPDVQSNRIFIAGFSQGAALSLFSGLQHKSTLGGIAALSGFLPYNNGAVSQILSDSNSKTPLLILHGQSDQVVPLYHAQKAHKLIQESRADNVELKQFKNLGHHSNEEELRYLSDWIKKILG